MKKIAVLIPVYNNIAFTQLCIRQLMDLSQDKQLNNCAISLIVIDDGSTDGTSDWIRKKHPSVHLLVGDGQLWWSGGINMGAKYACNELNADFLLLWNNDIITANDYFRQLDLIVAGFKERTVAGSKVYETGKEDIIWSFGGYFDPRTGNKLMIGTGQHDSDEFQHERTVDWLPGMGTLLPCSVIQDVGYWNDKDFPQYFGDSDYTLRLKEQGYELRVYPQLKIWNDKSSTGLMHQGDIKSLWRALTSLKSPSKVSSRLKFYRIHGNSIRAYQYPLIYYFKMIGGFIKWNILSLFGKHRPK